MNEESFSIVDEHEVRQARRLRIAIGLFASILLATVVASIHLSTLGVTFGSLVFGSGEVWRGHRAAFRICAVEGQTTRLLDAVTVHLALRDSMGTRHTVDSGERNVAVAELTLPIPKDLDPDAYLDVRVQTVHGVDKTTIPLTSVATPSTSGATIAHHDKALTKRRRRKDPETRLALYPEGGHAVRGLPNRVYGQVRSQGQPWSTTIRVPEMQQVAQSDAQGLFVLDLPARRSADELAFEVGDELTQTVKLGLDFRASQVRVQVDAGPIVQPGSTVPVEVTTLPFRDWLHLDLWVGGSLIQAITGTAYKEPWTLNLQIPDDAAGLVRIIAYRNLLISEDNAATATLWASSKASAQAISDALGALAALPGTDPILEQPRENAPKLPAPDTQRLTMAMSRVTVEPTGVPVLISTLNTREKAVQARISRARGHVHALFGLTFVLGLLLSLGWIVRHQRSVRQAVEAVLEDGSRSNEEIEEDSKRQLTKMTYSFDFVMILASLTLAVYAIWVLLSRLQWEWDL